MSSHSHEHVLPQGFLLSGVRCGIKEKGLDLALIYSESECSVAGVFTTNAFKAASVLVNREKINAGSARAVVINSGNANACTGAQGLINAHKMCESMALHADISPDSVLNASTGIIGRQLPMDKIKTGIKDAWLNVSINGLEDASKAIMTTDTVTKVTSYQIEYKGTKINLAGMCKGSGMICPNMATMLCFIMTDAQISHDQLQPMLASAVETSFNSLTVDGDMSTNDQVLALANGRANNAPIESNTELGDLFELGLSFVLTDLAKKVAADGEGATKFVEVRVVNALSYADAKSAAMTVANSPLVKTAIFGQDPNWGRVLCAAGRSSATIDAQKTSLYFGDVKIVENGEPLDVPAAQATKPMLEKQLAITIDLGLGASSATAFTCDFSYDYVKINAEYHT